jgi:hypothetical protein
MKKRAVQFKPERSKEETKTKRMIENAPSTSTTPKAHVGNESELLSGQDAQGDPFGGQVFDSEEGAINFLLESVVRRLGSDTPEGADMHDFLDMVLESDPTLRDELLAGATIRK